MKEGKISNLCQETSSPITEYLVDFYLLSADSDIDINIFSSKRHVMMAYRANGGKTTRILKLGVG
jgi:hypothetical protein